MEQFLTASSQNFLLWVPSELVELITRRLLFQEVVSLILCGSKQLNDVLWNRRGVLQARLSWMIPGSALGRLSQFRHLRRLHVDNNLALFCLVNLPNLNLPKSLEEVRFFSTFTFNNVGMPNYEAQLDLDDIFPNLKTLIWKKSGTLLDDHILAYPRNMERLILGGFRTCNIEILPKCLTALELSDFMPLDPGDIVKLPQAWTYLKSAVTGDEIFSSEVQNHLANLKHLSIHVSCSTFNNIPRQLEVLEVNGCLYGGPGMFDNIPLSLKRMEVWFGSDPPEMGYQWFERFSNLQSLSLGPKSVLNLQRWPNLPKLERLALNNHNVTPQELMALGSSLISTQPRLSW